MLKLLPHNESAVKEILEAYSKGMKRVVYCSGVGTGKSFCFLAVAEQLDKKILYVVPKHSIKENMEAYKDFSVVKNKVTFITFNQFTTAEKTTDILSDYGLVVIDECHHLGSDLFGRNLLSAMLKDKERLYLGLTATPVRFKTKTTMPDGSVKKDTDISKFFEKKVNGISNFEAIRLGLMPPFKYRLLEPDKDPKQLEKEYGYEVKAVVDYKNQSYDVIKEITRMYPRNKWICFFSSKAELKEHMDNVKRIFPQHKIFILYSDLRNLKEVIDGVSKVKKAVILSIDMLLEGVHLPDITGIILFRNVTTVSTFQQILGRVCSIGNKTEPLIVDCSRCGPKLLQQLLNESKEKNNSILERQSNIKPIMSIGIGLHREWESVNMFLKRLATLKEKTPGNALTEDLKEKILADFQTLRGKSLDKLDDLNKADKTLLKACCWKYEVKPDSFFIFVNAKEVIS